MHCKTTQHVINLFEQIKKVLVSISSNAQMHKCTNKCLYFMVFTSRQLRRRQICHEMRETTQCP